MLLLFLGVSSDNLHQVYTPGNGGTDGRELLSPASTTFALGIEASD